MKSKFTLIIVFLLISCKNDHEINFDVIDNLSVYTNAKDILLQNIDSINAYVDSQEVHLKFRSWNKYSFENNIVPLNPNFEELIPLWEKNYLTQDNVVSAIYLGQFGDVIFVTFHSSGIFSSIKHVLRYSAYNQTYPIGKSQEIIQKRKIDPNWSYIIVKSNYDY